MLANEYDLNSLRGLIRKLQECLLARIYYSVKTDFISGSVEHIKKKRRKQHGY